MQKLLRRAALAKRQAVRKARIQAEKKAYEERQVRHRELKEKGAAKADMLRNARIAKREDWELGPLAPRRGVGDEIETYGALPMALLRTRDVPEKCRPKFRNIVVGDRVVILEGRDKGKIGTVSDIEEDRDMLTVRDMNLVRLLRRMTFVVYLNHLLNERFADDLFVQVDIAVPKWMRERDGDFRMFQTMPRPLKPSQVRLVFPIRDQETEEFRDVIVEKFRIERYWDEFTGTYRHNRIIAGTRLAIPFPSQVEPEAVDHEDDTLRISVEEVTWVPTLLSAPMPSSVIDELRNKYSVFRDRHDPEYIAQKMQQDEDVEELKRKALEIQYPLRPKHIFGPARQEPPDLTEAMLAKIGEVMAKNIGVKVPAPTEAAQREVDLSTLPSEKMRPEGLRAG